MNSVFVNTQGLYQRRRAFNKSYRNDFTCNLGEIVPVYLEDLIPNTSWRCSTHGLVRFLPMIAPIMDNVDMYVHFWISPYRTLYGDDFTETLTGEKEADEWPGIYFTPKAVAKELYDEISLGQDEVHYLVGDGSIFDMLGYDTKLFVYNSEDDDWNSSSSGKLNARKFCMYFRLLSNWYTNENVDPFGGAEGSGSFIDLVKPFDKLDFLKDYQDGDISYLIAHIIAGFYGEYETAGFAPHAWPKDYGTSALPTLQYGLPTYLPLGESAPVTFKNILEDEENVEDFNFGVGGLDRLSIGGDGQLYGMDQNDQTHLVEPLANSSFGKDQLNATEAYADLSEATAITINELRIANALQVFKEREIRYGRKAPEYYKGFYGVTPGDLRLQLPKFLGGGRLPVNISDVEQTSASQSGSAQGNLAGKGTAIAAGFASASAFAPEESFIMGVAWLMPKVTYARCLSRHDTKLNDRFDYYNPSFAHIGEQPLFNFEMYAGSYGSAEGNKEFGYQPRYTEYRFHFNEMHGEFKNSLSFWTLGRIYNSQPTLNSKFIYMQPKALNRIFAVQTTSAGFIARNVLASLKFNVSVIQPLSRYGTPGLMP